MPVILGRTLRFRIKNRVEVNNQFGEMTAKSAWGAVLKIVDKEHGFSAAIRILGSVLPQENGCWLWPDTP